MNCFGMNRFRIDRFGINRFAICLLLSIILGSTSQLFLKAAAPDLTQIMSQYLQPDLPDGLWVFSAKILANHIAELVYLLSGLLFYAIAMFTWIITLQGYELSKAYPCLSLSYVLVYLGAVLMPGIQESLTLGTTLGVLLIVAGIYLVFRKPSTYTYELQS